MTFLFWLSLSLLIYTYIGYPVLIFFLGRVVPRYVDKGEIEPAVSVIISAWNEEAVIARRIKNLLSIVDYPADKIEILVGSDGSDDGTVAALRAFTDPRLRVFAFETRRGKMAVLNDLVPHAAGEILIFADCRQTFAINAVRKLVANFHDPEVGCVSGELLFNQKGSGTSKGVNLYWDYEKFIRQHESLFHSMAGATGAIYALRRELFSPIPADLVLDDMYVPLRAVLAGYRTVFERRAHAFDEVADNPGEESRRKARTLYGNYQIFWRMPELFVPWVSPVAFQLFSHKFLRVAAPFFLAAIFVSNLVLAAASGFFLMMFLTQILFYTLACLGSLCHGAKHGPLKILKNLGFVPYAFCLLNFSALWGFMRFVGRRQRVTWQKAK